MIDFKFCFKIAIFWLISTISLKFQHFDWFLPLNFLILHSNFNILSDSYHFDQISIFWSIWHLHSNFNILSNYHQLDQNSIFWSIWHFAHALKFQNYKRFQTFNTNCNILINFTFHTQICNIISDFKLFTQIATFWSNPTIYLKLQNFDRFPLFDWLDIGHFEQFLSFRSNFNTSIDSKLLTQIATYCSIWLLHSNFNIFDLFLLFHTNFNILINLIWQIALKFQHFDWFHTFYTICKVLINEFCTQISKFLSIPTISINFNIFIYFTFCNQISTIKRFTFFYTWIDLIFCTQISTF